MALATAMQESAARRPSGDIPRLPGLDIPILRRHPTNRRHTRLIALDAIRDHSLAFPRQHDFPSDSFQLTLGGATSALAAAREAGTDRDLIIPGRDRHEEVCDAPDQEGA
jgi:hypothetical protein